MVGRIITIIVSAITLGSIIRKYFQKDDGQSESVDEINENNASGNNNLASVIKRLDDAEKTARYHFNFAIGFAAIAIATGIAFVSSETLKSGLQPSIVAFVILSFGMAIMFLSAIDYKPKYFRKRIAITGIIVMLFGSGIVLAMSIVSISEAPVIKVLGLIVFALGIVITYFSPKRIPNS